MSELSRTSSSPAKVTPDLRGLASHDHPERHAAATSAIAEAAKRWGWELTDSITRLFAAEAIKAADKVDGR